MNILVISDLHIDTSDNFGTFRWDRKEFINHIELLRYNYKIDKVIFNGDIFESLKYSFSDIIRANRTLLRYFRNKDFIFIKGNHDILNKFGTDFYKITNSKGQSIHIEHGHNADWFNGSAFGRAIGRLGFILLKKMARYKPMMKLYFKIVAIEEQINHIPKRYNTLKYLTYALRLLKDNDVVILGHTHKLEAHHTYYLNKKKRYLNCGTCSLGRFQGIVLDTETLKYELMKETKETIPDIFAYSHAI